MHVMIGTTTGNASEAELIASACVEAGLCACAHIDEIKSFFRWDGEVQNETEFRVFLKTVEGRYAEIEALVRRMHSYDEPAVFCIPITHGSATYLDWMVKHSGGHIEI